MGRAQSASGEKKEHVNQVWGVLSLVKFVHQDAIRSGVGLLFV